MDYRIEKRDAMKLVCRKKHVAQSEISTFWNDCTKDGTIDELCRYGKFDSLNGLLGISFSSDLAELDFTYGIGAEYNGTPIEDEKFDVIDIPAYTYAVFTCKGKMPDAFSDTYKKICTEFFPQSNYEYGRGVELELYPSADVKNPEFTCEIWISVKEKMTA